MAGPAAGRLVVFGIDPHKATHTVVAVDEVGRQVDQRTVAARTPQHRELITWAHRTADDRDRVWAVEDCRHVSRRLERDLLAAGERIVRVPPKLMAATRMSVRTPGKSDPVDALAVARAALREPDLPTAHLDEPTRELKLLLDHREDLVAERTRVQNRLRWHVHELNPELQVPAGAMDQTVWLDQISRRLGQHLDQQPPAVSAVLVAIVAELVEHIRAMTARINQLTGQITGRVQRYAPQLLTLSGCGPLGAAKLLVETADVRRFKSEAAFAMHAGVAPVPGLVRQAAAPSAEPWRQPAAECRAAPDRDHPAPHQPAGAGVPTATAQRGKHPHGGAPRPQAAARAACVPPAPRRPTSTPPSP
jgi:transposase